MNLLDVHRTRAGSLLRDASKDQKAIALGVSHHRRERIARLFAALAAAESALRSYEHGNQSSALAKLTADTIAEEVGRYDLSTLRDAAVRLPRGGHSDG